MFFKKLRKGLSVVRDVLDVKVLYYVQLKYFVDKVCRRDHVLSFKKNLALFNVSTLRYKRNKINAKLLPHPLYMYGKLCLNFFRTLENIEKTKIIQNERVFNADSKYVIRI